MMKRNFCFYTDNNALLALLINVPFGRSLQDLKVTKYLKLQACFRSYEISMKDYANSGAFYKLLKSAIVIL